MLKTNHGIFKMQRELTKELLDWKNRENRKPLVMRGARQVGKTYSIEEFARLHFSRFVKINFEEQIELKSIFKTPDVDRILDELSILFSTEISPGKTLLFFDEIQACPEAIVALRYFYEKHPRLHVIAAGSLLDFTLKEINYAMPVGRVEFCYMYPMNFKEFLWALSQERLISYIENYDLQHDFSQAIHHKILGYLRAYLFVGGMPEAVKTYLNQKQLPAVERTHSSILTALQYDFAKYGIKQQQEHLLSVFRYCARNVGKKVKYANVDREVRSENLKQAFQRLQMSRLLHLVHHTNASRIPLMNGIKENVYKPLFLDRRSSEQVSVSIWIDRALAGSEPKSAPVKNRKKSNTDCFPCRFTCVFGCHSLSVRWDRPVLRRYFEAWF
jgi:predicted AAA+ superfamily ATPase